MFMFCGGLVEVTAEGLESRRGILWRHRGLVLPPLQELSWICASCRQEELGKAREALKKLQRAACSGGVSPQGQSSLTARVPIFQLLK